MEDFVVRLEYFFHGVETQLLREAAVVLEECLNEAGGDEERAMALFGERLEEEAGRGEEWAVAMDRSAHQAMTIEESVQGI